MIAGIEAHVPVGKKNAVSRKELSILSGFTDRQTRREVEQAVQRGHVIINHQDGAGYFRPNTPDKATQEDRLDVMREYKQEKARMMATKKRLRVLRSWLVASGDLPPKESKSKDKYKGEM